MLALLFGFGQSAPYVPGDPGGPWTPEELRIVKAKLYAIYSNGKKAMQLVNKMAAKDVDILPSAPKMVRLGFHSCVKYVFTILVKYFFAPYFVIIDTKMVKEDAMDAWIGKLCG